MVLIAENSDQTGGRSIAEADEVIAKGHPPMAEGVVLIDFDGTIQPFGYLFNAEVPPFEGAVETLNAWKEQGYKIVIFTSRLSPIWLESVGQTAQQHIEYMTEYLERYGIPFDGFTAQKVPSVAYIDDKAYRFENNWAELKERVLNG